MRNLFCCLSLLAISVAGVAQHIDDIQKELFPSFDKIKWSESYSTTIDYYPVDYSQWEVGPKYPEFESAFIGYYILDRFLRKRNRELMKDMDEKGRTAYAAKNKAWLTYRDKVCNKKWRPAENRFSMMVLDYLYCVNKKMRSHVDSLGGGIPPNDKVDKLPGFEKFKFGSDVKEFDSLVISSTGDDGYKYYNALWKVNFAGVTGNADLTFKNGKLLSATIKFDCDCGGYLSSYIIKNAGSPNESDYEPITMESIVKWRGRNRTIHLVYYLEVKDATLYLSR